MASSALTGVYVVLAFFEDTSSLGWDWLTVVLLALCAVFVLEFGIRFVDAPYPLDYLEQRWLDLITAIPFVGPLRALRHGSFPCSLVLAQEAVDRPSLPAPEALGLWNQAFSPHRNRGSLTVWGQPVKPRQANAVLDAASE